MRARPGSAPMRARPGSAPTVSPRAPPQSTTPAAHLHPCDGRRFWRWVESPPGLRGGVG